MKRESNMTYGIEQHTKQMPVIATDAVSKYPQPMQWIAILASSLRFERARSIKRRERILILRGTLRNASNVLQESTSKNRKRNAETIIQDIEKELARFEDWS